MNRGDLVLVLDPGSVASKARPCVVVQNQRSLGLTAFLTVCPLTSQLRDAELIRITVEPSGANGLERRSQVECDLIDSIRVERVGRRIGTLEAAVLRRVDTALRLWLDL